MSAAAAPRLLTVEEYLEADRAAERPSEYHDGEVFQIEDATWAHAAIVNNLAQGLGELLRGGPCRIVAQIRIRVRPAKFVYPDQVVVCGKPAFDDKYGDTITNPRVIFEVLSKSTAGYDYGNKFILYQHLPSFEEYVLVAQDLPRVTVFRKTAEARWLMSVYENLEAVAKIETLGVELPLARIYEHAFEGPEPTP
jgi:Uma2 family endonuclease